MRTSIDPRRMAPRLSLEGLCGVIARHDLCYALLIDLSALGVRLEKPFDPATATRLVQLEIELPGTDEVVWARGEVAFAHLSPMGGQHPDGQPRMWCRAGIRIDRIASAERRLLRDYVVETRRARRVRRPPPAASVLTVVPDPGARVPATGSAAGARWIDAYRAAC